MINKNFYIKNHIQSKHLNKKIRKKLNIKIPVIFRKIDYHIKNPKNLLYQLNSKFKFNFKLGNLKKFKKFKKIVIIGMGGSILGSEAIYNFLYHKINKKVIFLDNINLKEVENLKKEKDYKKTLFLVISKSGNTIETISNFVSLNIIKKNSKNIIIITEKKNNTLYELSKKFNLFYIEHKNFIGGRYSVLSEVGLVPAYLMGLNISKIRHDLLSLLKKKETVFLKNSCKTISNLLIQKKVTDLIFLNYSPRLEKFLFWCQQLIAESLGKRKLGFTPIVSNVPKDHHSLLQLYLDGPKNKIFYIFDDLDKDNFQINTKGLSKKINYINKKGLNEIKSAQKNSIISLLKNDSIPFREFYIKRIEESTIGKLFSYFILETILVGNLTGINPFDQPAVERAKIITKNILVKNSKKNF